MQLWVSRMCEAFSCLPSEIERERLRLPAGFLESVLETRAYERAHAAYEANPKAANKTGLLKLAEVITFELVQDDIDAKKAKT